jgi:hypothetical protein
MFSWLIVPALMTGCVQYESEFSDTLSAAGVAIISARVDRGDISYDVGSEAQFDISGRSWGRGTMSKKTALRNQEANSYSVRIVNDGLLLDATSDYTRAGVDFRVEGPWYMDTDILTKSGTVTLEEVEGYHTVTASRIVTYRVIGDVVFIGTGMGMDVELWPYTDGYIYLESSGGTVDVYLPYGGDYDVEIWGDVEYGVTVTDLGFDQFYLAEDYFAGERGSGAITVEVYASGGAVNLYEAL